MHSIVISTHRAGGRDRIPALVDSTAQNKRPTHSRSQQRIA